MSHREASQHADRIHTAIRAGEAVNSALVASWQRSAGLHQLDPTERRAPQRLEGPALSAAREQLQPLIRASQASLDRLFLAVGGMGCCVLIADRNGIPIERRGAAGDDALFEGWGLWPGSVWSEEREGTNGIGTCLVEQRAVTIHRDQHFFTRNTLLSCTTAPIHDHEGNVAAALDVSSCRHDLTEDLVNVIALAVADAARRIEAETFRMAYPSARIVVAATADGAPHALLAVDKDDVVVGATRAARQAYRASGGIIGKPVSMADGTDQALVGFEEELRQAERAILERALIRTGGNITAAARQLGLSRATLHRKLGKLGLDRPH
ncbi:transcriptional regulator [Azorhizobium oxalatiphilum]|uniref:Transcriptional regulator n=1 Tax=Azorhizobium oxalatiphilum TaxID=980631 RepID=A0A917FDU9_9HYPH|nr:GAF domain-containing protein [Azorhizobium oxalatiphilum]GGF68506.1 transcriptional regulator [Azorhizobium oxalatiphilum]